MIKKKKLLITVIIIIILIGLYLLLSTFNIFQKRNNVAITKNQVITGNSYLIDDDVNGLVGCTDQRILSQFSGYRLVKKTAYYIQDYYSIAIYNTNLDLTAIIEKEAKLKQKAELETNHMRKIEYRIDQINKDKEIYGYSDQISNLEEKYRLVDIISYDCGLESLNEFYTPIDKNLVFNLNLLLSGLLSGTINLEQLPSLNRQKTSGEHTFVYGPYKDGILGIEAGGSDGYEIHMFFIKNVGNKIYYLMSNPFLFIDSEDMTRSNSMWTLHPNKLYDTTDHKIIVKTLNCKTQTDCIDKTNNYIQNLFNRKEILPKYTNTYDKFTNTINYVFE